MSVSPISSLTSSLVSSVVQTSAGRPSTASGAGFGPPFVLGGSTQDFSEGLYNAIGDLQGAASTAPTVPATPSAAEEKRTDQLTDAAEKIGTGDIQAGREQAEALIENNADDASALYLVGYSYAQELNYEKAEQFYIRAAYFEPNNQQLQTDLATARSLQKSDESVLAEARTKIASPERRDEGISLLLRLTDRSPDNAGAYLALADAFSATGSTIQVIGAVQEALSAASGQDLDEVVRKAEALVEENPEAGITRNLLGRALEKAGRTDEAITQLRTANRGAPDNVAYIFDLADAYVRRATSKLKKNNVTSAQADMTAAQAIDPANGGLPGVAARVAAAKAGTDITAGLYNRAFAQLGTAAAKAPDDEAFKKKVASLYGRVAAKFENDNDDSVALTSYRRAYELDPESDFLERKVGELSYSEGLKAGTNNNRDTAIALLEQAYQTDRTNTTYRQALSNAYDQRGQFYTALDKPDEALADFKKGFSIDPTNASVDQNLSTALAAQGS